VADTGAIKIDIIIIIIIERIFIPEINRRLTIDISAMLWQI